MIKPEELRIGNYVFIDKALLNELADDLGEIIESEYFKVSLIDRMFCNVIINGKEVEFQLVDLNPIPLTEEWLIKFGFSQVFITDPQEPGAESKYWKGYFKIISHSGESFSLYYNDKPVNIKYIHQLQNLYFALTGKELTE